MAASSASSATDGRVLAQLSEQLAFYFSDANLRKDQFLLRATGKDGTSEVEVAVLAGFKRIQRLTRDVAQVRAALECLGELRLSDDNKRVRRLRPLPVRDDTDERTVYVEPLGAGVTHESVRAVFTPSGVVAYVSLPRLASGDLKGFGFVEFEETEGACAAAAALNGAASGAAAELSAGGGPLRVLPKCAWLASKAEYKAALARGQLEAQATEAGRQAAADAGAAFAEATAGEAERRTVVELSGLPKGAAIKPLRREMREALGAVAPVDFVDYGITDSGDTTRALVRMVTPVGAAEAQRVLSASGLRLAGVDVRVDILRGDALRVYLERMGEQRRRTSDTRKAKREKWWAKKWGSSTAAERGEAAEDDAVAEATEREPGAAEAEPEPPLRAKRRREVEGDAEGDAASQAPAGQRSRTSD